MLVKLNERLTVDTDDVAYIERKIEDDEVTPIVLHLYSSKKPIFLTIKEMQTLCRVGTTYAEEVMEED